MSANNRNINTLSTSNITYSKMDDLRMLVKLKLNITVVLSSVLAYFVVAKGDINIVSLLILSLGGFLVTGAANAFNQILEKDYDKLMTRTADRPLAAGRMTISEGVLIAGTMALIGITLLSMFNPVAAILGTFAMVSYAFVYTPMKRYTPLSVWVGGIPGALPVLIGTVAFEGYISITAIVLFVIQFLWQLPHFWAIGWLSYDDYQKAGYKLLPVKNQIRDNRIGLYSVIWASFLIPVVIYSLYIGLLGYLTFTVLMMLTLGYIFKGWKLYKEGNNEQAKSLMFYSFAYLPLALILFIVGTSLI